MRIKPMFLSALLAAFVAASSWAAAPEAAPAGPTVDDALTLLKEGNARFVAGKAEHPNQDAARLTATASGQKPFATVLTCSDSRVSPELVFDRGIGELFVIRVAGNVTDVDEAGTIDYGVGHLGTPLIVVMGHAKCGAVTAVVKKADVHGDIARLVDNIAPAVDDARAANPALDMDALVAASIKANVFRSMRDLIARSREVRELVAAGKVRVVGAVYDLATGQVEWVGPHPAQAELMTAAEHASGAAEHGDVPAAHVAPVVVAIAPPAVAHKESVVTATNATVTAASLASVHTSVDAHDTMTTPAKAAAADMTIWYVAGGAGLLVAVGGGWWFFSGRGDDAGQQLNSDYSRSTAMKMKLSAKLGLGFAGVLAITVALGGLAVWKMKAAVVGADKLANQYVPEVGIATGMNDAFGQASLAMRTYGLTADEAQLAKYRKAMDGVQKSLADAEALTARFPELVRLKEDGAKAKSAVDDYLRLAEVTERQNAALAGAREAMLKAATGLMTSLDALAAEQRQKMDKDIEAGLEPGMLHERVEKITLVNDVQRLVGQCRLNVFRAQALRDQTIFKENDAKFSTVFAELARLRGMLKSPADIKAVDSVKADVTAYQAATVSLTDAITSLADIGKQRSATGDTLRALLDEISNTGMTRTTTVAGESSTTLSSAATLIEIGLGVAILVGAAMAIGITRSITGPLNRIIASLSAGAEQTTSAANQVSASSQSLAQGASEQAASLEETSSSLEEMSSMTKKNADTAQQAASLATEAKSAADKGNGAMVRMATAIKEIEKSAGETAKIIKTIDEIAFQTNLLALNAAVEAARAGEAGKGFAVVAEEVRNLAMRSAEAAKNTSSLIEGSVNNARNGVMIADEVGSTLGEIVTASEKVSSLVHEIAAASGEQAQGIGQVNTAVTQMDKVTQSNAAAAEESASASEELSAQAEQLASIVNDLAAIVGGSQAAEARAAAARPQQGHRLIQPPQIRPKTSAIVAAKPARSGPKSAATKEIPFNEDGDFGEFGKAA